MINYDAPCGTGNCELMPGLTADNSLCNNIAQTLVDAGASGIFEVTPCPFEVTNVISKGNDQRSIELREKLGIVGLIES